MKGELYYEISRDEPKKNELGIKEMQRCAERIWNALSKYLSKYVVFDGDAIFKDPDWPYLWDKEKPTNQPSEEEMLLQKISKSEKNL